MKKGGLKEAMKKGGLKEAMKKGGSVVGGLSHPSTNYCHIINSPSRGTSISTRLTSHLEERIHSYISPA